MTFVRTIEDALLQVLNEEMGIPVIIAHSGGPEPQGEYGVLRFIVADKLHRNSVHFYDTDDGFEELVRQDFLLRFNLRFYGQSSNDRAFQSQAILATRNIQEELYNVAHISYADVTSIQNNPEMRPTEYVPRALYDVKFLSGFEYKRKIDWFDTVSYEGEYITPDGRVLLTDEQTVSASDN